MVTAAGAMFQEPSPDTPLWRYMDLAKFVHLVQTRSLFLPRATLLAAVDRFEGTYTRVNAAEWDRLAEMSRNGGFFGSPEEARRFQQQSAQFMRDGVTQKSFVTCWHMNQSDSMAMWKIYGASDASVALHTTYAQLNAATPDWLGFGKVRYVNEHTDAVAAGPIFAPLTSKRTAYEYEQEVRGIAWSLSGVGAEKEYIKHNETAAGLPVPIANWPSAFLAVYLHPAAPQWFGDVVRGISSKYETGIPIMQSPLSDGPVW